jgi:hypothetical protein
MWLTTLTLWTCSLVGLACTSDSAPGVSTIQTAYEREASEANSRHDKGLRVLEAKCDDGADGRFLCQVTFLSKDDPTERLYFDIVSVTRGRAGWELRSGLCKR